MEDAKVVDALQSKGLDYAIQVAKGFKDGYWKTDGDLRKWAVDEGFTVQTSAAFPIR